MKMVALFVFLTYLSLGVTGFIHSIPGPDFRVHAEKSRGKTDAFENAVYVWRDPNRDGTPFDMATARELVSFATAVGVGVVFYDNFGDGTSDQGTGIQTAETLATIIEFLHRQCPTVPNGGDTN